MSERKDRGRPTPVVTSPPMLPWVLLLFVGSGAAALVYEVVWFQLIQLIIGATAVSLGVLLATFMGGMCAGSLLLPRFVPATRHPLRVYAQLELGVAVCGLLILFGLPALGHLYVANVGQGFAGILFRGVLCGICLLPPTILMGATLPAVSRWVDNSRDGVAWLGFFYGGNIAGAVFGSLISGFYLLRVYDMATATYVAVAGNMAVAALGYVLAARTTARRDVPVTDAPVTFDRTAWPTYVATGLSGMAALGAEVIWTRILALLLGATVYTFSIIAATFLAGLGIGSTVAAWVGRSSRRPGLLLAGCQVGVALGIAWAAALMSRAFPYWPIDPALATGPWFNFQIDLVRAAIAILPAAFFWGASFPIAIAAVAPRAHDPARLVGGLYATNTVGAVAGALLFSLLLIPAVGTATSQQILIWIALAAAVVMIVGTAAADAPLPFSRRVMLAAGAVVIAVVAASTVIAVPPDLIAYGRQIATFRGASFLYTGEGLNSSIAVSESEGGIRNFHVSGKVEASTEVHDMRLQRLLGHMSALMNPHPKSVLVVGFGAGVTAGSFLLHPDVERIVICEIEPLIPERVAPYFAKENYDIVHNPKVQIVYDDARHFILTTHEKFDVITSDPIHPWVKGAASLYTKDYFDLVKQHLNPGGVVTQWVPLYQSSEEVIKSELATFFDVFPWGTIWSNQYANGGGYDVIVLAKPEPLQFDPSALAARLNSRDHADVAAALTEVEIPGVDGLLATYAGSARDLKPWLADAQVNSDTNLRLEYLAGMANNVYDPQIYEDILAYRKFPDDMLIGSPEEKERLRPIMTQPAKAPGTK